MKVHSANSSLLSNYYAGKICHKLGTIHTFCTPLLHEECGLRVGIIQILDRHLNKLWIETSGVYFVTDKTVWKCY